MTEQAYYMGVLNDLRDLVAIINFEKSTVMNGKTVRELKKDLKKIKKEII